MKATFIVNPISGRSSKESIVGAIAGSVDMDRYEVTIRFTAAPGHVTTLASEAVQSGQQLVVAVGGNGFHVAPKASLTDGLIDVTIIHPIKPLNALPMPVQILGYSFDKNPGVETFKTSSLTIRRATPAPLHIDGEPQSGTRDITIALRPASLGVLCGDGEV